MRLLHNLNLLEKPEEKYEYLIELSCILPKLRPDQKTQNNRIVGCHNPVWLNFEIIETKVIISGESDSRLVSGLIAILIDIFSNKTREEIIQINTSWIDNNELNLSMTRVKGLNSILKKIIEF
jgi:cysteine desulfuration protein SufE